MAQLTEELYEGQEMLNGIPREDGIKLKTASKIKNFQGKDQLRSELVARHIIIKPEHN